MAALSWSLKILFLCVSFIPAISIDSNNSLRPHQDLENGHTLISSNGRFELGFFDGSTCLTNGSNRGFHYLALWYRGIWPLTVVWVANRMTPLRGTGPKLCLNPGGDLLLRDDKGSIIFLAKLNQTVTRPSLVLLDSGNLVIKDGKNESEERYVWQSFDLPSDTLLPGMKLGWGLEATVDRVLTSWRASDDPSGGEYVFSVKSPKSPQLLLEKNRVPQSRWGPWNGKGFSGTTFKDNPVFKTVYHSSLEEVYFTFEMLDDSVLLRLVVSSAGAVQFLIWKSRISTWVPMVTLNKDVCDRYGSCGPYGICYPNEPGCQCLKGFQANSPLDWRRLDATDGCRRKTALNCTDGDGFTQYSGVKLPDRFTVWQGLNPTDCANSCLQKCNCMAYTSIDLYGNGSNCVVWLDKLIDIRDSPHDGDELYIRMARAELVIRAFQVPLAESILHSHRKKNATIISSVLGAAFFAAILLWCAIKKCRFSSNRANRQVGVNKDEPSQVQKNDQFVHLFDMATVSAATNDFALANKIGQGGFGPVYQGELPNGKQIAVKRLSENSNQGLQEFKNEVNLIAQLQHRNLVKLLGCCVEGDERILIYEYMPNKSLDQFIFAEPAIRSLLPWGTRISILKGIAKGLDYLHYGSTLRIIHRDLKASNILLDNEMNPKISDFGLARNCENEWEERTGRVIGTHGYMSPEYVMDGHYSTKSDVFSFGVLALEIVSGQRNWGFHHPDHDFNLLGHAWKLWSEGKELALVDPVLDESFDEGEATRCIQIGLLCVQQGIEERPTMPQVVSMLENDNLRLSEPQEPGFFNQRSAGISIGWNQLDSVNWLTVTTISVRE